MNSTAQPAIDPQAQLPTGPTHVASRSTHTAATPGAWKPTDRWAWACGLPVSGIARAVANCIARHANDKTGMGWPGIGTIVTETGFCRTAVIAAIKELERGGHVTVSRFKVGKKNRANRYQLPPMGSALCGLVEGGSSGGGSALDGLGGSASDGPESVRTESVKNRTSAARATLPAGRPDDEQTNICKAYERIRNCPQCHAYERGHDDTCQSCDWTREAWEARES